MTINGIEDLERNKIVADIAFEQVIKNAPREKPLFPALRNQYFKDPERALKCEADKGEKLILESEVAVAVGLMTPIILAVVEAVFTSIMEEVKKTFINESSSFIYDTVKKRFKIFASAGDEKEKTPTLTFDSKQLHNIAFKKARLFNLSEKKAELLADSVISGLVLEAATTDEAMNITGNEIGTDDSAATGGSVPKVR